MIEETEEPVKILVDATLQELLLQHVLEVVDSFFRVSSSGSCKRLQGGCVAVIDKLNVSSI